MAEAVLSQDYRTREEEEQQAKEPKVRFQDISLAAAYLAATHQAFSPEQIRKDIQSQWVKTVTKELKRSDKFKGVYEGKRKAESRQEYSVRRNQQAALESAVADLMVSHGEQLFEKGIGTSTVTRESLGNFVNEDYKELDPVKAELLAEVARAQNKLAPGFKEMNEKNNKRFKGDRLAEIKQAEQIEAQSAIATRRELKAELAPLEQQAALIEQSKDSQTSKKAQLNKIKQQANAIRTEKEIGQKAVSRILATHDINSLSEEEFLVLFRTEVNQTLYGRNGRKKYKIDKIDEEKLAATARHYSQYFKALPNQLRPRPLPTPPATQKSALRERLTPSFNWDALKGFKWPSFSFPKFDWSGIQGLFGPESSFSSVMGNGLTGMGNFLGKLPGLSGFFGGGAAGTAAAAGGTAAAGATAAAGGAAAATGGAAVAAGGAAAAPVLGIAAIAVVVVLLILILGVLAFSMFDNPSVKPYALSQQATPVPEAPLGVPSTTVTPKPPFKIAEGDLEEVMVLAAESTCTPLAMIKAISRREAGSTWNYSEGQFGFYNSFPWWNNEEDYQAQPIQRPVICTGFGYNTCTNEIASDSQFAGDYCGSGPRSGICVANAEVMGPMQFEKGTWNGYKSSVEAKLSENGINRQADRRVITDAFIAAGLKLNRDSGATNCSAWSTQEIENAARRYYGKCTYTIGTGGNYCAEVCGYYNQYSEQTVDCNQIGS